MKKLLAGLFFLCCIAAPARAATEVIDIYSLPISEAAQVVQSQLSATGKVIELPSQRRLVIEDDTEHLDKAKALLKQLDQSTPQYSAIVELADFNSTQLNGSQLSGAATVGSLPGGWVQLAVNSDRQRSRSTQMFQLRISAARPGSIETGTIRSFSRETQLWLSGYGIVKANSVELVPITSGFTVTAWPVGNDQVRVRITPWMQRLDPQVSGRHEMLIDMGTARTPATPPSGKADMRLNAVPQLQGNPVIEIAGATTEVTMPLDQTITLAASSSEAGKLGAALLAGQSSVGKREFIIRLRMTR
ncbi:hypothetical protein Ga0123461_0258 [Mariprofundus aestuarium]|uniref:Type II and III secretion system protein n=1 Tax=Mariprofundus aestuarium TaxID=1921086 RepID=A0A2K8KV95_MARES|nr:type II and III secretion system family protein [Mariprofundus aestuarium]ATX78710.1 hypothetical protein Ga0123461_0258 [Mariprofundus aestuarium]